MNIIIIIIIIISCALYNQENSLDYVSCGEDGSCHCWSGTELIQSIPHPGTVWTALGLPAVSSTTTNNNSFLTGCQDGQLRLFTPATVIYQSQPMIQSLNTIFESEVQQSILSQQQGPSAEEIAKAPLWENRSQYLANKEENHVMVFNQQNQLIAAQLVSGSWVVIGTVTGKGDGGEINGIQYDHVMPVEIETATGLQHLQLGYNNLENPFDAAQRFMNQNNLSQYYLQQIADWIQRHAGNQQAPTLGNNTNTTNHSTPAPYSIMFNET